MLYITMRNAGCDTETIAMLAEMCNGETSNLIVNNTETRDFTIKKGVRQGGLSSPLCFNMIPEMLSRALSQQTQGIKIPTLNRKVNHLLYADDLILFGADDAELRCLINATSRWADQYKLEINELKTEVIAINCNKQPVIYINKTLIQSSNPTYLGFTIDKNLKGNEHMKSRVRKGRQKLQATLAILHRLPHLKLNLQANIARACVLSVLGYGTEGDYLPQACHKYIAELDVLQRKAARLLLKTP